MGLMNILKKLKEKEREIRLLVLGLDNAGKTTIVKKFNNDDINDISPTLGFNIYTLDHKNFKLNVWDIGGQTSLRAYWRNYFENTDGLIWVVDSVDKLRLSDCAKSLHLLLQEERLLGASLLVFANKQDLPGALSAQQIENFLDLKSLKNRHYMIIGCSGHSGENLLEGIDWLIEDISTRIFTF
ncbi:ADP-ribosylation factor-like protein 2 [Tetranychus urticae]|uniref:ADP-ribosylation factor-like protein 2 n=1 Tax=Tetranychus urticae TaxID=32264 RepID=T1KML4_TETUR|nr:ADP-ribosylation factor-like protein 2 [Tetranychus urticae]